MNEQPKNVEGFEENYDELVGRHSDYGVEMKRLLDEEHDLIHYGKGEMDFKRLEQIHYQQSEIIHWQGEIEKKLAELNQRS